MTDKERDLIEAACRVRDSAHAPYSGLRVGAALQAGGNIFLGCNVENASYGLTICAERGALAAAVSGGHRAFRRLVLVTDDERAVPPCGACRAVLAEFSPGLQVLAEGEEERKEWSLADLLPLPFRLDISREDE